MILFEEGKTKNKLIGYKSLPYFQEIKNSFIFFYFEGEIGEMKE